MKAEFHIENEDARRKMITQLQQLIALPGWRLIKKELENFKLAKEQELFKTEQNATAKYTEMEIVRREREHLQTLLEYPYQMIQYLKQHSNEEIEPNSYDPFLSASHVEEQIPEEMID